MFNSLFSCFLIISQTLNQQIYSFFSFKYLYFIKIGLSLHFNCENSSVGRARPCQGRGRGSESRFSLSEQTARRRVSLFFSKMESAFLKFQTLIAQMVELVDTHVSGTCGLGCASSSLALGTNLNY